MPSEEPDSIPDAEDQQSPPDEHPAGPPWQRTLYASWFAQLLSITAFSTVMPFIPFYIRELGVRDQAQVSLWSGITITGSGLMLTIFSPVWGTLSDRFGRKIMVERAMFGGAVVLLVMGMVTNVYQLVVMRALQGCLTGTIVASTTLVSSITPRDKLAYSLGLMQTAVLTGNCLGPWIGGIMADHWGYRVPFYVSSGLLVLGGVAVLAGVREQFQRQPPGQPAKRGLRKAFGTEGLIALLGVFFFMSFANSFVAPIFPLFVEKIAVGYKPASITGMLIGITGVAAGISAIIVGRLSDRFGHRPTLVATTAFSGLCTIPQALVTNIGQLFALRVMGGLATGGTSPVMNAIIGTTAPVDIYGRAYGFCSSASSLGWAIGPLVGAALSSHLGLRWPFAIMGVMILVNALLVYLFLKPTGPSQARVTPEPAD